MPDTITIPVTKYLDLLESDLTLTALQNAGVDNWDGYDHVNWTSIRVKLDAAEKEFDDEPTDPMHSASGLCESGPDGVTCVVTDGTHRNIHHGGRPVPGDAS